MTLCETSDQLKIRYKTKIFFIQRIKSRGMINGCGGNKHICNTRSVTKTMTVHEVEKDHGNILIQMKDLKIGDGFNDGVIISCVQCSP